MVLGEWFIIVALETHRKYILSFIWYTRISVFSAMWIILIFLQIIFSNETFTLEAESLMIEKRHLNISTKLLLYFLRTVENKMAFLLCYSHVFLKSVKLCKTKWQFFLVIKYFMIFLALQMPEYCIFFFTFY